jgi:hypothetical protein
MVAAESISYQTPEAWGPPPGPDRLPRFVALQAGTLG